MAADERCFVLGINNTYTVSYEKKQGKWEVSDLYVVSASNRK